MQKPRTAEYLYLLNQVDDLLKIQAIESKTEFGTTYYEYIVYFHEQVCEELSGDHKRMEEFGQSEGAAIFDLDCVITGDEFDEVIFRMFDLQIERGEI